MFCGLVVPISGPPKLIQENDFESARQRVRRGPASDLAKFTLDPVRGVRLREVAVVLRYIMTPDDLASEERDLARARARVSRTTCPH